MLDFEDETMKPLPKPCDYNYVNADWISGIIEKYCDPTFQCRFIESKGHIIIEVPAGVKVPVRVTRGAADEELTKNTYYIRRPGPKSEEPQSGLEWQELLQRCIDNRQGELAATVRRVLKAMDAEPEEDIEAASEGRIDDLLE